MTTPHILLVEDDPEIATLVARYLSSNDMRVSRAGDGREMDRVLRDARIDLIILDIMLPGEDGLSICRRLRTSSQVPIIMLTARTDDVDRIVGLELGADDYLGKPFNPRELLARVRAVLRRREPLQAAERRGQTVLTFSGWRLDVIRRKLFDPSGARIALTGAEFDLLLVLCEHPGRVLSREQIVDLTQGRQTGPFERSVDVLISRLRQKIERDPRDPEFIQTVRSSGYLFAPEVGRE
ncbi:MAG: response regulator [Hyphomicrobiales bacterium]